jgi:hypothetical protein
MEFRFYALTESATLQLVEQTKATGSFAKARLEVERYFENHIVGKEKRQVLVLCDRIADLPGGLVAAEAVYMAHLSGKVREDQQVRTLMWLVEENVPKH